MGGLAHERKTGKTLIKNLGILFFVSAIVLVALLELYYQLTKRKESAYKDSDKIITH